MSTLTVVPPDAFRRPVGRQGHTHTCSTCLVSKRASQFYRTDRLPGCPDGELYSDCISCFREKQTARRGAVAKLNEADYGPGALAHRVIAPSAPRHSLADRARAFRKPSTKPRRSLVDGMIMAAWAAAAYTNDTMRLMESYTSLLEGFMAAFEQHMGASMAEEERHAFLTAVMDRARVITATEVARRVKPVVHDGMNQEGMSYAAWASGGYTDATLQLMEHQLAFMEAFIEVAGGIDPALMAQMMAGAATIALAVNAQERREIERARREVSLG